MPIVINSLGGGHTYTHTHKHSHRINFKKPNVYQSVTGMPDLKMRERMKA